MSEPTDLEKMRAFVESYPNFAELGGLAIDYADRVPGAASLFPGGLVERRRRTDLLGNVTVENQYNFALYAVLGKAPGDDVGATANAELVADFQRWVQAQSVQGLAPTFGDEPRTESMTAQSGAIYSASDEGTAVYAIQLAATFIKRFVRG